MRASSDATRRRGRAHCARPYRTVPTQRWSGKRFAFRAVASRWRNHNAPSAGLYNSPDNPPGTQATVNLIGKRTVLVGLLGAILAIHALLFWFWWRSAAEGYADFTIFYT